MTLMRKIFDNRVLRFFVLFIAVMAVDVGCWAIPAIAMKSTPALNTDAFRIASSALGAAALLLVYWLLVRLMEHRPVRELKLSALPGALGGIVIGLGLFVAVIGALWQLGYAHVEQTPGQPLAAALNMAVLSGVGEELVFRGVLFRIFEEMFGSLVALIVSAAFFGLAHLGNPGATAMSGAAIMLEAGLLLAAFYMFARSLWLAMGVHAGWNFAEGGIFGGEVSGQKFHGLLHTTLTGPDLWSGGKFGAEGSIVAVAVCTAVALAVLTLAIRRGEWKGLRLAVNDRGA
jgi:membrane protease YdiL (CAAX protease family)